MYSDRQAGKQSNRLEEHTRMRITRIVHRLATHGTLFCFLVGTVLRAQTCPVIDDAATHTKVGQQMPPVSVTSTSGQTFSLASQKGKVVLVNFWATWCPPCRLEMPRLEKEIWQKFKSDPNFSMIAIAREQTEDEIKAFQQKNQYSFPLASDPKRTTYALFAESGIPRSYVVGRDGKILVQTLGYTAGDFDCLETVLQHALTEARK